MMRKVLLFTIGWLLTQNVFADCNVGQMAFSSYATSGNASDYVSFSDQKITATITPNVTVESLATVNSIPFPSSDIVAFEYIINKPINLTGSEYTGGWALHFAQYNGTNSGLAFAVVESANGGVKTVAPTGHVTPSTSTQASFSGASNRLGVYVNKQTKQVGYIENGVNKGYLWSYTDPMNNLNFTLINGFDGFASNSTKLGQKISFELVTDKSQLINSYPSGSTDICGTTL